MIRHLADFAIGGYVALCCLADGSAFRFFLSCLHGWFR